MKITQGKNTTCIVGILGLKLPPQLGEAFILGDSFIKTYYTHFDVGNSKVGFARAKWFDYQNIIIIYKINN